MTTNARTEPVVALQLREITKTFGSVVALRDVSVTVRTGTVHALLGENGAGKSTLMRIVTGLEMPDRGEVSLFGGVAGRRTVAESAAAGVGMVHQHLTLVPNLTTTENFALGRHGLYRRTDVNALLAATSAETGLNVRADVPVHKLSLVEQQRLEIVKAVALGARLLILDEPTSVLAPAEIDELLTWVRAFAARGGTVVFVTHKLREVLAVADDVTVLRRGAVVHSGPVRGETTESLALAIFGEGSTLEEEASSPSPVRNERVASVDGLELRDERGIARVRGATFALHRGDIVGLAGVEGAGHRELMLALGGFRHAASGTLR